jgi:hypothetical protein
MVQGLNLGGGEILCTGSDQPWGPPSLLYNEYQVSFLRVQQLGHGIDHPRPSRVQVKKRVELYLILPLWAFTACSKVKFTFTIYLVLHLVLTFAQ